MSYTAYSTYDPYYTGTRSRRPSLSYGTATPASFYSQPGVPLSSSYHGGYSQPAYSMYASTTGNMSNYHLPTTFQPMPVPRRRRSSSVSYHPSSAGFMDGFRRGSPSIVKFKRKGALTSGVTIAEAQANVRLSGWDSYTFHDLAVDSRGKIYVNIRWPGYPPLNYEIPVDGYSGYVDLQSLVRRVGRAVTHYLQANVIPVPWDRIELQYLEELSYGTWQLKMST